MISTFSLFAILNSPGYSPNTRPGLFNFTPGYSTTIGITRMPRSMPTPDQESHQVPH